MGIKDLIEDSVTNSTGFYDSPREHRIIKENIETFLDLKVYLAAKEANMRVSSIRARDFSEYLKICDYIGKLRSLYGSTALNLDTQEEIDDVIEELDSARREPIELNEAA